MCGKSVRRQIDMLANRAGLIPTDEQLDLPVGDVMPGSQSIIIVESNNVRSLKTKIWGYNIMEKLVYNARSESYLEKPSFMTSERCIIPVDGFYEGNQLFTSTDRESLYLAGLTRNDRFVMLTQDSQHTKIERFYHRAPVVVYDINDWVKNARLPFLSNSDEFVLHESLYKVA